MGIPPSLTGAFGSAGTTNNFLALKTLVERLNYVRGIITDFWKEQIKIVQKAMGFRTPAMVEFDIMYLEDPASMTNILLNMADRNIISDEFVQRHIKSNPDVESRRINNENKYRDNKDLEKVSPYHQVDKDHSLKKIALQNGIITPSEVGLELDDRKEGEVPLVEMRESNKKGEVNEKSAPGSPGRPKNSVDTKPRKPREFKPKTKASAEIWAKKTQKEISDIINPVLLESFSKASLRSLSGEEFTELEQIKFEILCNLTIGQDITKESIKEAAKIEGEKERM